MILVGYHGKYGTKRDVFKNGKLTWNALQTIEEKLPFIKVSFDYIKKIKEMIIPPMGDGSLV